MSKPTVLRTNELLSDLCGVLGLPSTKVGRLVLELVPGEPVIVGVEMRPEKEDGDAIVGVIATSVVRHNLTPVEGSQ